MKSIKEKADEYAKAYLFSPLSQRAPNIHFEAGANYVLDEGEQKPAWSEEDEKMLKDTIRFCELCGNQVSANWLKSLIPQNWTKEDKERYISCLQRLGTGNPEQPETINSKWFKEHVYPQSTWKPSDEQMGALNAINVTGGVSYAGQGQELINLYNDLKKLREE